MRQTIVQQIGKEISEAVRPDPIKGFLGRFDKTAVRIEKLDDPIAGLLISVYLDVHDKNARNGETVLLEMYDEGRAVLSAIRKAISSCRKTGPLVKKVELASASINTIAGGYQSSYVFMLNPVPSLVKAMGHFHALTLYTYEHAHV